MSSGLIVVLTLLCLLSTIAAPAQAATKEVALKDLNVEEVIYLPTTIAQREIPFTIPKSWRLSSGSHINLVFQHSLVLLPQSSWIQVLVNDKVVKHIALTSANAEITEVKIPLPVANLKDLNTLSFRVEQHYTDHCEDPLDQSLWTQVLADTKMVLEYQSVLDDLDLIEYPYPIIDSYAYGSTPVRYIIPASLSANELQALAYLNVNFAQSSSGNELITTVANAGDKDDGKSHLVYVGTPSDNAGIRQWASQLSSMGQGLSGNNWSNVSGDGGLIAVFPHPQQPNRAVLIISGNTEKGVYQAARYISTRPIEANVEGQVALVDGEWLPEQNRTAKTPRYIVDETRTFAELGFGLQSVQKVNAPPIIYNIPFMADYDPTTTNSKAYLDLVYSYSAGVNPLFSSLELRLNNVSIGSVPLLDQENGEEMAKATLPIPTELIQPHNQLIAQFHLKPDKFGYCVGDFKDDAWGKIYEESQIRIEGDPKTRLPNIGLINYTGFPYSRNDSLSNMHLSLAGTLDDAMLNTMLAFTSRLGRSTLADTDLRFTVGQGVENLPRDKHLVIIRDLSETLEAPDGLDLMWNAGDMGLTKKVSWQDVDVFKALKNQVMTMFDNGAGAYLQQHRSPFSKDHVISILSYSNKKGSDSLITVFQDDEAFGKIVPAQSELLVLDDLSLAPMNPLSLYEEAHSATQQTQNWFSNIPWMIILWVVLGLILLFAIIPLIIRKIRYGV